ncbi:hypothetical protein HELRODRAFT_172897 [Helobdella robusta]|uniref:HAT C-terminal dimerisation domain-containing protein n=1 Tax=Helobdella robusta TaxID=6412 RepID=T1F634_HELRO|nr:hypothetical protein HELRODRAFT_172897 [Helobdella robusta]ESO03873.1 hypothetical protein HELRODRAFT_172897 [Helobdella robusta]
MDKLLILDEFKFQISFSEQQTSGQTSECEDDFMFAIDIIEKLNELNNKLQGNGLFAHDMYYHVKSFQSKLALFSRQADENKFCHFPLLKQELISAEVAQKYKEQIHDLAREFERRFEDFKNLEPLFTILTTPFCIKTDEIPEDLQLELLDMQANCELKEKFKSGLLLEFYGSLSDVAFPNLLQKCFQYLDPHIYANKHSLV